MKPTTQWWKVESWNRKEIVPVEVVAETPRMVTVVETDYMGKKNERRRNKVGSYFPTWIQAKEYLLEVATRERERAQSSLDRATNRLQVIGKLVDPTSGVKRESVTTPQEENAHESVLQEKSL